MGQLMAESIEFHKSRGEEDALILIAKLEERLRQVGDYSDGQGYDGTPQFLGIIAG